MNKDKHNENSQLDSVANNSEECETVDLHEPVYADTPEVVWRREMVRRAYQYEIERSKRHGEWF